MTKKRALVWIRRDLRLDDHAPLAHASTVAEDVAVVFVFDSKILAPLEKTDRRVGFIHQTLAILEAELKQKGSSLVVRHGDPVEEIPKVAQALGADAVFAGRDYEPYAKQRDAAVSKALASIGVEFDTLKDQVVFEGLEIKTKTGGAYKVFTPYKNAWLAELSEQHYEERRPDALKFTPRRETEKVSQPWSLEDLGFSPLPLWLEAGPAAAQKRLKRFGDPMARYEDARNFPSVEGTSGLSVHLRFGTVSVRACVRAARSRESRGSVVWLSELVWRDFYHMILDQYPHVATGAFRREYDSLSWPGSEKHFQAWCEGRTGYPIIDAAMRQLNETGWMHNRLRMVTASFLTKDLLVDYKRGEAYFARHLLDFDLAANNGGWQWSASTGVDAQPYFRVFNPYSQSERFDPAGEFIRAEVPELRAIKGKQVHRPDWKALGPGVYPAPIVDHDVQRDKAIALFKSRKKQ